MFQPELTALEAAVRNGEARDLVRRVAESPGFQRSHRLREFLIFICERTIAGCPQELREQSIGHRVFHRKVDYNPAEDNIVRVEARQLRKRLDEYFAAEGIAERVLITVPKGSYVPRFEPRPTSAPPIAVLELSPVPLVERSPAPEIPVVLPIAPKNGNAKRWLWMALVGALVVGLAFAGWLWTNSHAHQSATAQFWSTLFSRDRETYVVCADSSLVLLQDITHRPIHLNDYLERRYADNLPPLGPGLADLAHMLPKKQYTSIADARLVERFAHLNGGWWGQTSVRSARNMEMMDFRSRNVIMLGSTRSNPWLELFDSTLNFEWCFDEQRGDPFLRNRQPRPGEDSLYRAKRSDGRSYSIIALLPNLSHSGRVLVIAGTSMEGTEAAGELVADPEALDRLLARIGAVSKGQVKNFEALLVSKSVAGSAENASLLTFRLHNGI